MQEVRFAFDALTFQELARYPPEERSQRYTQLLAFRWRLLDHLARRAFGNSADRSC